MNPTLVLVIGLIAGFLISLFRSRSTSAKADATELNLASVTKMEKLKLVLTEKEANDKVKTYQDALKKYDPNFNGDGNKPAS